MPGPLRVVHLCANDLRGGAARSAYRLHTALQEAGLDSRMCVQEKQSKDPSVTVLRQQRSGSGLMGRIAHDLDQRRLAAVRARRRSRGMFSLASVPWPHDALPAHDILNIHWVSGFIGPAEILHYARSGAPVVWTLHDLNPFTGGCHFPGSCTRYENACGCCPVLESSQLRDLSRRAWEQKNRCFGLLGAGDVCFVSPSRWLADAARSSALLKRQGVSVIPYGIDLAIYRPQHREAMRSILGIPQSGRVVLVVAARLSDERKAGAAFFTALGAAVAAMGNNVVVVSAGKDIPVFDDPIMHKALGMVENETVLAALYSCADVFLMPTMDDNLPNAALEAMACGLPVVSYATGGMPDIVGEDEAGVLVAKGDVAGLLAVVTTLLENPGRLERFRVVARERAEKLFAKERQASRYISLYETAIENMKTGRRA